MIASPQNVAGKLSSTASEIKGQPTEAHLSQEEIQLLHCGCEDQCLTIAQQPIRQDPKPEKQKQQAGKSGTGQQEQQHPSSDATTATAEATTATIEATAEAIAEATAEATPEETATMAETTTATAEATVATAIDSIPEKPPSLLQLSESIRTSTLVGSKHSSESWTARTGESEVIFLDFLCRELEGIKEGIARIEKLLVKTDEEKSIPKEKGSSQPTERENLHEDEGTSIDNQNNQKQAGNCVFCLKKTHHKYQLFCPALKSMHPGKVWKIAKKNGITCKMCLGVDHNARSCEGVKKGSLKKCSIKDDQGKVCGQFHNRFLHQRKRSA